MPTRSERVRGRKYQIAVNAPQSLRRAGRQDGADLEQHPVQLDQRQRKESGIGASAAKDPSLEVARRRIGLHASEAAQRSGRTIPAKAAESSKP